MIPPQHLTRAGGAITGTLRFMLDHPAGKRITVMGLGRFGGGVGVTRWLADHGAHVTVTDLRNEDDLRPSIEAIADYIALGQVRLALGGHVESDFTQTDAIVVNPAVPRPWTNPYLNAARQADVPLTSEIRLFTERINRDRVIGVTGTAGKSTTAAMIHHMLGRAGIGAHLVGNIGGSMLLRINDIGDDDWIVLELSSAMLYWLREAVGYADALSWSPHVAVLTNVQPNHLDWHETFGHYVACKQQIFHAQRPGDYAITAQCVKQTQVTLTLPEHLPGDHNQYNAQLGAVAAARATGLDEPVLGNSLRDFPGLPHRLQRVGHHAGKQFFNDSKSTTPEATVRAVRAFDAPARVHLIAGGYDKNVDLQPISDLAGELAGLYTIGATGRSIANAASSNETVHVCDTLAVAVEIAIHHMDEDDVLLLSPGCASWDQFEHYEQRGEQFVELVQQHIHRVKHI